MGVGLIYGPARPCLRLRGTTMHRVPLIMIVSTDFAGQVRGKGFPASELDARLEKGVGWTFTNTMINCFGQIPATPWGPRGDLIVVPDPATKVDVDFDGLEAAMKRQRTTALASCSSSRRTTIRRARKFLPKHPRHRVA